MGPRTIRRWAKAPAVAALHRHTLPLQPAAFGLSSLHTAQIAGLPVEQALASLSSSPDGLSEREAQRRQREFGPNRLEAVRSTPLWMRFAREFSHFFALILWVAAGLAFFAENLDPGQGMRQLGIAIIGVILINGVFSFWQEYRAERALEALRRLLPQRIRVLRDGQVQELGVESLVPGDILLLEEGDKVPADCRLIEAFGIRVNAATITGESLPKARNAEPDRNDTPLTARNLVLAGTTVVSGLARGVVFATGMHTEFGKIAHLTQSTGETPSPLQREIARLSRLIAMMAAALGLAFFLIGQTIGLPFWDNFMFAIGIIVANVPEGLLPTVTLSLAMATQRMARRNALVRHLPAVETLGSTTVICSDKTGTLTQNRMTVKRLFADDRFHEPDVGSASAPAVASLLALLRTAAVCHDVHRVVRNGMAELRGDPMEVALVELAERRGLSLDVARRLAELPFDSERKRMSVVGEEDGTRMLRCKGALESLLSVCDLVQCGGGEQPLDAASRARLLAAQNAMAASGLRVLAFACRRLESGEEPREEHLTLCGLVGLEDPPRPEVAPAIARCRSAGIKVVMITGDHPATAVAIAREIGLVRGATPVVLRGDALPKMTKAELQLALDAPEILFARVTAEQKMLIVQALRRKGEIVAVTGDGVNDAPALKAADIGIAMGITGTDVAKEAADMILLDDNFASIIGAVEEGRAVFENLRKFLTYILTSNIPELLPYLAFVLFKIPLPLTVIQILAVDLGTDMLPALALGAEAPHAGLMREPPRARTERLLHWPLLLRAYLWLGVMEAAISLAAFFHVLGEAGWRYGESLDRHDPVYLQATAACLAAIVLAQVVNVFLCRHPRHSVVRFGLMSNPLLLSGIALELGLILLIVYTEPGNALFGTAPLPGNWWLWILPFVVAMGLADEVRKRLIRRFKSP
ncbi:cation-translocating P-type ATPase [Methylolobus aquaticus]